MAAHDVQIVPYEKAHGEFIAANMRALDRREIFQLAALTSWNAIEMSTATADRVHTAMIDGEPGAIWGINRKSIFSDIGVPWLLATDAIEKPVRRVLAESVRYFKAFEELYEYQENWVLTEHEKAVKWLRWLGFEMEEPAPFGPFGVSCIRFGKGLDQCV